MRPVLALLVTFALAVASPVASAVRSQTSSPALTWRPTTPLPRGVDHHATFATRGSLGDLLWVAGGNDYKTTHANVVRGRIDAAGSIGEWRESTPLPAARAGLAVAQSDRYVIVSGGKDPTQRTMTDVFVAAIAADGTLGAWRSTTPLPAPRFHHTMFVHGADLYVIGGLEGSVSVDAVLRARVADDGSIARWETLPSLPQPRSHHGLVVDRGWIYLTGGLDGNPAGRNTPLPSVIRARLTDDGIGAWETQTDLPHAYATHASVAFGGQLHVIGGVEDNTRFVDAILRAPIGAGGRLGAWQKLDPGLPAARSHVHQTPVVNGRLYSAGGSNARVVKTEVYVGERSARF
jgi:N-acetylneuraminic acid mutarotase